MSTKKRKPLSSAMEEFVFGTKEAAVPPTPEAASPSPQASQAAEIPPAPITLEAALPIAKLPQPEASAPEPVSIQSKAPSLISKLQAPDKEATVRFTVEMSVGRALQAVDVGSKDGAQESGLLVRLLLETG